MSSMTSLFGFTSPAVKRLLGWKQGIRLPVALCLLFTVKIFDLCGLKLLKCLLCSFFQEGLSLTLFLYMLLSLPLHVSCCMLADT